MRCRRRPGSRFYRLDRLLAAKHAGSRSMTSSPRPPARRPSTPAGVRESALFPPLPLRASGRAPAKAPVYYSLPDRVTPRECLVPHPFGPTTFPSCYPSNKPLPRGQPAGLLKWPAAALPLTLLKRCLRLHGLPHAHNQRRQGRRSLAASRDCTPHYFLAPHRRRNTKPQTHRKRGSHAPREIGRAAG